MSKKIIILSCIVCTLFSLHLAYAQDASAAIDITASPLNPKPGDTVLLTLSSYSVDLGVAKITWYVDNVAIGGDIGQKTFSMQAKNDGSPSAIKAIVENPDGSTNEVDKEITPAGVDLIIEPTGFVPPFYKGKALFINQGTFRAVAIPDIFVDGQQVATQDLTFKWQENDSVLQSSSGRGQNTVTINGTVPIRDITLSVQVLDSSGNVVAQTSKIISANQPQLLFYEDSPLYGVLFNKAITDSYYLGQRQEVDIVAEPYFFNVSSDTSGNLNYQWSMNGNAITPTGKVNELIMRQDTKNLAGTASISLTLNSLARIFQFGTAGFSVNFGQ